jgi:hypothetical protein
METEEIAVDLEKCEPRHYPIISEEFFTEAQLGNSFCPKQQNYTLEGFWGEKAVIYVKLAVEMCNYDEKPDYCYSHEKIKNFISEKGLNLNIFYLEYAVDVKYYTNPLRSYVGSFYKYFDTNKNKVGEYFLQTENLITDAGLVFEEIQKQNFFKLVEMQTDTLDFDPSSKQLMNFIVYSSNVYNKTFRKYVKAPEVLANLGGIIKILYLGFQICNLGFSRKNKFQIVIKRNFRF